MWNGPTPVPRPDPANSQPWVNDLVRQRQQEYYRTRPSYQCRPSGPEAERFGGWKRILQTPTAIAILNDDLTYRVIHMDGRELEADPAPSWMGYSVGRWDGDTLVVDSIGFNDKTWVSRYGESHTEALRVTERYRRPDFGHLQVEVTFTDPAAYAKPWGFTVDMALAADTEMLEAVCERSSEHWAGSLSDAANSAVTVAPDVLARYVGVYSGIYLGNRRTVEVSLSGGQLIAKIRRRRRRRRRRDRGRWCRNLRRCSKGWDWATSSLSTTRVWRRTSWRFTYRAPGGTRGSRDGFRTLRPRPTTARDRTMRRRRLTGVRRPELLIPETVTRVAPGLERETHAELHLARVLRARDPTEVRVAEDPVREVEVRAVQEVEDLPAELELRAFRRVRHVFARTKSMLAKPGPTTLLRRARCRR